MTFCQSLLRLRARHDVVQATRVALSRDQLRNFETDN